MEEKNYNNTAKSHKVLLVNRGNGAFSGVVDVLSFDVAEILLETELGMLLIKGQDLHVNRLSLEKGEVDIEGRIDSLTYCQNGGKTGGISSGKAVPIDGGKHIDLSGIAVSREFCAGRNGTFLSL